MNVTVTEENYQKLVDVKNAFYSSLQILQENKVNREVAIVITELEKAIAFLEYTLKKLE